MTYEKEVKKGEVYKIVHKRKGAFVAQVLGFEDGDEADEMLIAVKYDVRPGTSQYNMNVGGKQDVRVSALRPSLIVSMDKTEEQQWLREVEVEYDESKDQPGLLKRIFGGK